MPRLLVLLLLLGLVPRATAQNRADDTEPPVANRREPFSGAVGQRFVVTTHTDLTTVPVGDPFLFTIRVVAEGPWHRPPQRPDLRGRPEYAAFKKAFHIEKANDRYEEDRKLWEFDFVLRPLDETVSAVPRLPFVYYRPRVGYQTTGAPAIPLTVKARQAITPNEVKGEMAAPYFPDPIFHFSEGEELLRRDEAAGMPPASVVLGVLLGVPLGCAIWYITWRIRFPEAARQAQLRRSHAARVALRALRQAPRGDAVAQLRYLMSILATYLRDRFEVAVEEPTAQEVAAALQDRGIAADQIPKLAELYRRSDSAQYAGSDPGDLAAWRQDIAAAILSLEAASCGSAQP